MRNWLTPRCILIGVLLVAAPGAALTHLLVAWVPEAVALARVNLRIARTSDRLASVTQEGEKAAAAAKRLQRDLANLTRWRSGWLPQRDQNEVFDQIARALLHDEVSIEQLTMDAPVLYAAAARSNVLACEQVNVLCRGSYAGLGACLDRIGRLELPLRPVRVMWGNAGDGLTLSFLLEVPFVPDAALGERLADAAGIEDKDES